jgi:hypothetical protein
VTTWFWAKDVIVSGLFYNPHAGSTQPFSYGFMVREDWEGSNILFVVHSNGTWHLKRFNATTFEFDPVAQGQAPDLRAGAGDANRLGVAVVGDGALVTLNGEVLADTAGRDVFHLGPGGQSGLVSIVDGYFVGTERAGSVTRFEDVLSTEVVNYADLSAAREALTKRSAGGSPSQPLQRELQAAELE